MTDRWLMRVKDFIIVSTALIALVKWFYVNPLQMEDRVNTQQAILTNLVVEVQKQGKTLERIDERLKGIDRTLKRTE